MAPVAKGVLAQVVGFTIERLRMGLPADLRFFLPANADCDAAGLLSRAAPPDAPCLC